MKNKFNLNLAFLYQLPLVRDYAIGGGFDEELHEWMFKYDNEKEDFQKFQKKATINDLIYIYIRSFTEKTPSIRRLASTIADTSEEVSKSFTKYLTSRSDVTAFESSSIMGNNINGLLPEGRDRFEKELTMFFGQSYNMSVIDEALQGLIYEKETDGSMTTYKVQDGVIDTLVATPNKIVITISDDKLVDYYRTFPRNPD